MTAESPMWGLNSPPDRDLSQSPTLNPLSHAGAPQTLKMGLFGNKEEWSTGRGCRLDGPRKHWAPCKKPDAKGDISCDSTDTRRPDQANPQEQTADEWWQRLGGAGGVQSRCYSSGWGEETLSHCYRDSRTEERCCDFVTLLAHRHLFSKLLSQSLPLPVAQALAKYYRLYFYSQILISTHYVDRLNPHKNL